MEQWRPVVVSSRFRYEVSSFGNVRKGAWVDSRGRRRGGRPVTVFTNPHNGYSYCNLGGKQYRVHRLVMWAFVGVRPRDMVTNHINRNKADNRLCNLEYVTQRDNVLHSIRALGNWVKPKKLTVAAVREIRSAKTGIVALAEKFGVSYTTIKAVRRGDTWNGA